MLLPEAIVTLRALAQAAEQVGERGTAELFSGTACAIESSMHAHHGPRVVEGFADLFQACETGLRGEASSALLMARERLLARADMFSRAAEALQIAAKGGA